MNGIECNEQTADRKVEGLPRVGDISLHYVRDYFGAGRAIMLLGRAGLVFDGVLPVMVSKVAFWQLCVDSIIELNDEAHGSTSRPVPKSTFGAIYSAVNQMDTIGEGFRKFVELIPISPADIVASLGHARDAVHLHFHYAKDVELTTRLERYLESCVLVFHCVLLWIAARPVAPIHVRLSQMLDEKDGSLLSGICGNRSRHGVGITLTYGRDDLAVPLGARKYKVWAAHETATFLQIVANAEQEQAQSSSDIIHALRALLTKRSFDQQQAAATMGLSAATLRRRLADFGTTFRAISQDVRREKLRALLATGECLDDVAEQLGFSDRRSLWRTCQRLARHVAHGVASAPFGGGRQVRQPISPCPTMCREHRGTTARGFCLS